MPRVNRSPILVQPAVQANLAQSDGETRPEQEAKQAEPMSNEQFIVYLVITAAVLVALHWLERTLHPHR